MSQHELTARIAYEIYVQRGRAHGRQGEDWRAAEAIVAMCLAFATELARVTAPEATGETEAEEQPSLHERALALLQAAVEESGRARVAKKLGYKSASTVGRYVRGDRQIGESLAQKIVAKLAQPNAPALRLAA